MGKINLISKIRTFSPPHPRLRDRRAFWASSTLSDRRDQFWEWTGVEPTNPTEFTARFRMMLGDAIEKALVDQIFSKLHFEGVHLISSQVQVGSNEPVPWDGYVDIYLAERLDDGSFSPYVVEVKTKWGNGADYLAREYTEPEFRDYFFQLGLYLKDFYDSGKHVSGCLFMVLLSNDHFGEMLQYHCEYDPGSNSVVCTEVINNNGDRTKLNLKFCLDEVFERWKSLKESIETNKCPPGDYEYKYPLTPQALESFRDNELKKAIKEGIVIGDWQPKYSKYKSKIIEEDKIVPFYTDDERKLLCQEYERRFPKARITKSKKE